jgi:acyl-CoA synthetase (NDP forming)/GNAT superfamily N-acetyltransferase
MTGDDATPVPEDAPYPSRWESDVALVDGGVVHVRPIRPDDGSRLEAFHERQSPESVYFRFFSPRPRLSKRDVERFTHVDYLDRMAFVALLGDDMIGVARYDRHPARSDAEVAFFTDDGHHGRGLATVLLEYLAAAAREAGITGFTAQVLPANRRMLRVFTQAGFGAKSHYEDGVVEVQLAIEPTPEGLATIESRAARGEAASVARLLAPSSVAVIGASRREGTIAHAIFRHLLKGGFEGPVYPVNPEAAYVGSVRSVPTVIDVPGEVDLAVVVVPADQVLAVVEDCARKRVHSLLVVSTGFSDSDDEGWEREQELVTLARRHGMRLIGPNSVGAINTDPAVRLLATVAPGQPLPGGIGLSAQSSTIGVAILEHLRLLGLGVSSFVDVGNKADVSGNDLLQYWEHDDRTEVVILYLESFGNPRNFNRIARRVSRSKPIVAMKPRRALPGSERSHDDDRDLPDEAVDALLRQTGVIRVDSLDEMLGVTRLLSHQPLPGGNRMGVVSNGWSPALLAVDAGTAQGLELATGVENPRILGSDAGASHYADAVGALLADEGVDSVLALYSPLFAHEGEEVAQAVVDVAAGHPDKPVVAAFLGLLEPFTVTSGARQVPVFLFPDAAARALGRLTAYRTWRSLPPGSLPDLSTDDAVVAGALTARVLADAPDGRWLDPYEVTELLACYGMPVVDQRLVRTVDEAIAAAHEVGYPVAVKATGLSRLNKTEAGGVALDVYGDDELRAAYERMRAVHGDAMVPAQVQTMVPPGVDVCLNVVRHPALGPVLSIGPGGAAADGAPPADRHLVPLTDEEAHRFVAGSHLGPELSMMGPEAVPATEALVARLASLADAVPEIAEARLNPVIVTGDTTAVTDARVRLAPIEAPEPTVRRLR